MISFYLNSLYDLLNQVNPVMWFWDNTYKNWRAFRNIRTNQKRAQLKITELNGRLHAMEAFMENPAHIHIRREHLDVYR